MSIQESEQPAEGVKNRYHFNKQLIREIVRSVERGATRREIIDRYGMSKSTLSTWIHEYGSAAYIASQTPLKPAERRSLVRSVTEGRMSIDEARRAFNLPSSSVVKRYLQQAEKEKAELSRIAQLMEKNEVRSEAISSEDAVALKKALEEAELKIKALNTLIDVAEDQFKISIRKKPGAKQS